MHGAWDYVNNHPNLRAEPKNKGVYWNPRLCVLFFSLIDPFTSDVAYRKHHFTTSCGIWNIIYNFLSVCKKLSTTSSQGLIWVGGVDWGSIILILCLSTIWFTSTWTNNSCKQGVQWDANQSLRQTIINRDLEQKAKGVAHFILFMMVVEHWQLTSFSSWWW